MKQSDKRGFSARSTGALDTKSLPTRSFGSKSHTERTSSSCIRFGVDETLNLLVGLPPEDVALFHAMYRTSIKGRRDIVSLMFGEDHDILKIDKSYTSRIAEIFGVYLKFIGIDLEFLDNDDNSILSLDNSSIGQYEVNGKTVLCTEYEAYLMDAYAKIQKEVLDNDPIMTTEALNAAVEQVMRERGFIDTKIKDSEISDFKDFLNDPKIIDEIRESVEEEKARFKAICEEEENYSLESEIESVK